MLDLPRLENKVAIITGASSGQGACEAQLFTQEGATVIATDVNFPQLESVVEAIKNEGGNIFAVQHDVSNESDWEQVIQYAKDTCGKIDILINNAGVTGKTKGIHKLGLDEWDFINSVNIKGTYLGMKHVIPEMLDSGGSIVNISSIAGFVGSSSSTAYTASKGAVRSLTKNVALDYAKYKIRVNSVHPGYIVTPMVTPHLSDPKMKQFMHDMTPLPYLGEPIDVAYAVLYLASDEAKYVTGSELVIDGGYIAR